MSSSVAQSCVELGFLETLSQKWTKLYTVIKGGGVYILGRVIMVDMNTCLIWMVTG
jgi:hypothetical protein